MFSTPLASPQDNQMCKGCGYELSAAVPNTVPIIQTQTLLPSAVVQLHCRSPHSPNSFPDTRQNSRQSQLHSNFNLKFQFPSPSLSTFCQHPHVEGRNTAIGYLEIIMQLLFSSRSSQFLSKLTLDVATASSSP